MIVVMNVTLKIIRVSRIEIRSRATFMSEKNVRSLTVSIRLGTTVGVRSQVLMTGAWKRCVILTVNSALRM